MKTIQMTIDDRLLNLVDKMSRAQKTSRSAFIRIALEAEIRRQRVSEEEARHLDVMPASPSSLGNSTSGTPSRIGSKLSCGCHPP